jgi:peptidoglycan/LPS O-acetylase OafA/YrhL
MTLGRGLSSGRTGNLDTLRLLLAASVVVSHAWPLALGPGTAEPLSALTGHSLGGWAVALFFFLSGLLVTASAERRDARAFWVARFRGGSCRASARRCWSRLAWPGERRGRPA